jgi:hypothetical protein
MTVFIIYIGLFFAATGAYAIIHSIQKLGNDKSDSSLDVKGFKISAPAGFIYGIASFLIVVLLIKFNSDIVPPSSSAGSGFYQLTFNKDSTLMNVKFDSQRPASIFKGKVLIQKDGWDIQFDGVLSVSKKPNEPNFSNNSIEFDKGTKFYIMTKDSATWGVNVIKTQSPVELEIYKE